MKQAASSLSKTCLHVLQAPWGSFHVRSWNPPVLSFTLNLSWWNRPASLTLWPSSWFPFCKGGTWLLYLTYFSAHSLNASKPHFLPLIMHKAIKQKCSLQGGGGIVAVTARDTSQQAVGCVHLGWGLAGKLVCVLLNKFTSLPATVSKHERRIHCVSCSVLCLVLFLSFNFQTSISPVWELHSLNLWLVRNEAVTTSTRGYYHVATCELSLIFFFVLLCISPDFCNKSVFIL